MGPLGWPETVFIFFLALILFGPKKLPELGRTLGKALSEFRRAKNELKATLETHMQELERETRLESGSSYTPPSYSYPYDEYGQHDTGYGTTPELSDSSTAGALPATTETHPAEAASSESGSAATHSEASALLPAANAV